MRLKNIAKDQRIGRWTILADAGLNTHGNRFWLAQCDCGTVKTVMDGNLKDESSTSCGCFRREQKRKYGKEAFGGTPVYHAWHDMWRRCTDTSHKAWKDYGGRGINVCERWKEFTNFFQDMGHPSESHVLDRQDNDQGYFKDNCRWATKKESGKNRRTTIWINYQDHRWTILDLGRHLSIPDSTFYRWFRKEGMSIEGIIKRYANGTTRIL